MPSTMWIAAAIIVLLLVAVAWMLFSRKKKHEIDYYALFILGIMWIPLSLTQDNYAFSSIGLVMAIVGLVNKDKWKTNRRSISKMGKNERLIITTVTGLLVLAVLAGIIYFIATRYY